MKNQDLFFETRNERSSTFRTSFKTFKVLVSLFNDQSNIVGYLMIKPSFLKNSGSTI